MNFMVFQDYFARFLKKWKRNTVEPFIISNNTCVDLPKIENHIRLDIYLFSSRSSSKVNVHSSVHPVVRLFQVWLEQ